MEYDALIVGCGLSGAVIAERYAQAGKKVLIIDKRDHIGGNCYDFVDSTGILCNKYGAHIFHTNHEDVWEYVNRFSEWIRYEHKVVGAVEGTLVPIPVNITTVNMLCGQTIQTETEMNAWLREHQVKYDVIENGEQMAKSRVGEVLYEKIFKEYTFKQWNKYPEELSPDVLARLPVRNNFDDRYFTDKYQALPKHGYTHFFQKLLNHENITVRLSTDYTDLRDSFHGTVIYTGPIDAYFSGEKLEYRSIDFVFERYEMNYYQTHPVVNYPSSNEKEPFTRIVEYKHFTHQQSPHTVIVKEFSTDVGEPYYPVLNEKNLQLFETYKQMAAHVPSVHFLGRLANYKYFNMDAAIKNALTYFEEYLR